MWYKNGTNHDNHNIQRQAIHWSSRPELPPWPGSSSSSGSQALQHIKPVHLIPEQWLFHSFAVCNNKGGTDETCNRFEHLFHSHHWSVCESLTCRFKCTWIPFINQLMAIGHARRSMFQLLSNFCAFHMKRCWSVLCCPHCLESRCRIVWRGKKQEVCAVSYSICSNDVKLQELNSWIGIIS